MFGWCMISKVIPPFFCFPLVGDHPVCLNLTWRLCSSREGSGCVLPGRGGGGTDS